MQEHLLHLKVLVKRLGIVLLIFTLCRILFYLFNSSYFTNVGFSEFWGGLQFDLSAIFIINAPFMVLSLIPFPVRDRKWHKISLKVLFHGVNGLAYGLNCADIEYFKFTLKRSTADLFQQTGGDEDLSRLIPSLLADFWHILLIMAVLIAVAEFLYRKTQHQNSGPKGWKNIGIQSGVFVGVFAISVIISRGGFQLRPISIINASQYTTASNIPLVLNTPFTIIKTLGKGGLQTINVYEPDELATIYTPIQQYNSADAPRDMNVVLIIMESFSAEYMGCITGGTSYTPFLDSLSEHALLFTNAFANGKKSIEGIPAVTNSIPTLMHSPYIISSYSGNKLNGLAQVLKERGYSTSFYHGAKNGSMGFDGFAAVAGFDRYYGRTEYGNDDHHDGTWGIFDEEYLQYWAKGLSQESKPFISCFFSLTSHHPYPLPERYESVFPDGELPIHKIVQYSDYSLKRFFETVANESWYENTLFVICADHTSSALAPEYRNSLGTFRIPIIFFTPNGELTGTDERVAQQIDIMPTVLSYLNYPKSFLAFGNNLLADEPRFCVNYLNDVYQLITNEYLLQFDGQNTLALYRYHDDALLQNNLLEQEPGTVKELERLMLAYLQQYNNRMIENRLTPDE